VKSAAAALARAIAQAKTTAARVAAIDKIMDLYTSEVEHLALAYAARDRVTFTQLAGELGLAYAKLGCWPGWCGS
jgi:hypothetical protein